jgi:hypothetical protein
LAVWLPGIAPAHTALACELRCVALPLKPLPALAEIEREWRQCTDRVLKERLFRKIGVRRAVGDGDTTAAPLWAWRLGTFAIVAHPNEAYSVFQQSLRAAAAPTPTPSRAGQAGTALAVVNLANGPCAGYLPPRASYDRHQYAVWQTPLAAGALERLTEAARALSLLVQD